MFHNMLMTALTPLGSTNEVRQWENMPFTTVWPEQKLHEKEAEVPVTRIERRKPKRLRTSYTTDQLKVLEKTYTRFKYIDAERRRELAASLNIGEKSIKVWFQNRRMKEKRESSESSCDSSSEISREMTPPHFQTKPAFEYSSAPQKNTVNLEPRYDIPVFHVQAYPDQFYGQSRVPITQYQDDHQNVTTTTEQTELFARESSVYPTQYYPNTTYYNYSAGNYYDNIGVTSSDYWSPSGFDLSYFQTNC